jgi:multidrug efflux pump subunit AcrA (membrane-fusion protein)
MADRPRRRRWWVGVVLIAIVVGAAATAWAGSRPGPSYRTAEARRGAVAELLTTTGTLSPVQQADADFQVAGSVSSVSVTTGQRIHAGDVLARLRRGSLRSAVVSAESTLATAAAQLESDRTQQTDSTGGTSNDTSRASGGSVSQQQAQVLSAVQRSDADLAKAQAALLAEAKACGTTSGSGTSSGSGPTPTSTSSPRPTTAATQRSTLLAKAASTATSTARCSAALTGALRDQNQVEQDQQQVQRAEQALSAALSSSSSTGTSTTSSRSSSQAPATGASGSTTGSGATVTAAALATDQATVDQARAQLASARADLRQATLLAPIDGRVAAVSIHRGSSVSGTSGTDPAVEIVGSDQVNATIDVTDAQVRTIKTGMTASVTPDGSEHTLSGRVVAVGTVGATSSSGSVSYPVTIDVNAHGRHLTAGADAAVSVTLRSAHDVVIVPTSAVHHRGTTAYVEVMDGTTPHRRTVAVGAVGAAWTQVSAVRPGERVELADIGAAVPSSSTLSGRFGTGGFSGGLSSGFGGGPQQVQISGGPPGGG